MRRLVNDDGVLRQADAFQGCDLPALPDPDGSHGLAGGEFSVRYCHTALGISANTKPQSQSVSLGLSVAGVKLPRSPCSVMLSPSGKRAGE
jgi:hypothetical protein